MSAVVLPERHSSNASICSDPPAVWPAGSLASSDDPRTRAAADSDHASSAGAGPGSGMTAPTNEREPTALAEPVIGFRQWTVTDGRLQAISGRFVWPVGDLEATCTQHACHTPPAPDCECGLYALHEPRRDSPLYNGVWGAVLAWGRLEVHLDGIRASAMRPLVLMTQADFDLAELSDVATHYGVPVLPWDAAIAFASEFGSPVPPEARPRPVATLLKRLTRAVRARELLAPPPTHRGTRPLDLLCANPDTTLAEALLAGTGCARAAACALSVG